MVLVKSVIALRDTGEAFSGTLIRYRSLGKWLTLRDASLKGTDVDGFVRIPKANVSFVQVVGR